MNMEQCAAEIIIRLALEAVDGNGQREHIVEKMAKEFLPRRELTEEEKKSLIGHVLKTEFSLAGRPKIEGVKTEEKTINLDNSEDAKIWASGLPDMQKHNLLVVLREWAGETKEKRIPTMGSVLADLELLPFDQKQGVFGIVRDTTEGKKILDTYYNERVEEDDDLINVNHIDGIDFKNDYPSIVDAVKEEGGLFTSDEIKDEIENNMGDYVYLTTRGDGDTDMTVEIKVNR